MSFLHYLCLLAYNGVQQILCYDFVSFFFILHTLCSQFLWIVHFLLSFRYSLEFIEHYENAVAVLLVCVVYNIIQHAAEHDIPQWIHQV